MSQDRSARLIAPVLSMPDLTGTYYTHVLATLHEALRPKTYLEIGVETGSTLAVARCAAIGIDPEFQFGDIELVKRIIAKPSLMLYQMPSDAFFAQHSPATLFGAPIDMAFLDGMHRCEYLLRDFINTERHCRTNAVVALHDCVPLEMPMAQRLRGLNAIDPRRRNMWTGDVWRTALLLKRVRPDLAITVLDAAPTGLVLITNLDPRSTVLSDGYAGFVQRMMGWSLEDITLPGYYREIGVEAAQNLSAHEDITARFWL